MPVSLIEIKKSLQRFKNLVLEVPQSGSYEKPVLFGWAFVLEQNGIEVYTEQKQYVLAEVLPNWELWPKPTCFLTCSLSAAVILLEIPCLFRSVQSSPTYFHISLQILPLFRIQTPWAVSQNIFLFLSFCYSLSKNHL